MNSSPCSFASAIAATSAVAMATRALTVCLACGWLAVPAVGQTAGGSQPPLMEAPASEPSLRFNFSGADWRSVLEWFSQQADLSLQLDEVPRGSFTFADPSRGYSISEALDVVNLALMKRGYCVVRRGRLLQTIDLESDNADKLISEIAELVAPDQLDRRGGSDIVSTVFPLGSLTPQAARDELAQLVGPWGRVIVLESARQVKVTETTTKLIAIRDLLRNATTAESEVIEIVLRHRAADEVLEIARPLLELEPGSNSNENIRISVGPLGDRIYATGSPGKTGLLRSLIEKADSPLETAASSDTELAVPVFQTHAINVADSATVFDVLQTLLSGTPDARIAIDPKTDSIVAWARPQTHEMIAKSIAEMEGNGQDFEVIELRQLDPAQALLTINKFFGVDEDGNGEGPIVDGDPATGKLWIRGTRDQIAIVQRLIAQLEGPDGLDDMSDKVRILPFVGQEARDALAQGINLWQLTGRQNLVRVVAAPSTLATDGQRGLPERRVSRPEPAVDPSMLAPRPSASSTGQPANPPPAGPPVERPTNSTEARLGISGGLTWVTEPAQPEAAALPIERQFPADDIVVQLTPTGMVIASNDIEALDAFETLMRSIAQPNVATSELPTIFWLKYARAESAADLISKVLSDSADSFDSVIGDVTEGFGGGMLGSLIGLGGGGTGSEESGSSTSTSIVTATGSISMVPDARLNALIVKAGPSDLQMVEMLLEKIDRAESPEDVQTQGRPGIIPLVYQDATEVAKVVKEVFSASIQAPSSSSANQNRQPSPTEFLQALRGGRGGGRRGGGGGGGGGSANQPTTSEPTKISISVDTKSNSLVVVATPQDFADVKTLVSALDEGGKTTEETVETFAISGNVNPEVMQLALESILGTSTSSSQSAEGSPGSSSATSSNRNQNSSNVRAANDIQQRLELLRSLRGSNPGRNSNAQRAGDGRRRGGGGGGGRNAGAGGRRSGEQ